MHKDSYGLDVTCASDAALNAFVAAMDCSQRFDGTAIEEFRDVVALDEEFALAHAALGRQYFMHGHGGRSAEHFNLANSFLDSVTPRESNAIQIAHAAASSDPSAISMAREHVVKFPNDVFVLAHLLGPFGLLAFSGVTDWAEENVALLKATKRHYRADDWWHLTTEGFFAAEEGRLSDARIACERAWAISENGNCAHSLAHLHFEVCALDEGRNFIYDWAKKYGEQSNMRHHLLWHLAMIDLESGLEPRDVFEAYDFDLYPANNGPSPLEMLSDNAAFLWRCNLADVDIPNELRDELFQYAGSTFGFVGFAFADAHKSMAAALQPDESERATLNSQLSSFATTAGTAVADLIAKHSVAVCDFADANYANVIDVLEPLLDKSVLIGGSNPQRRIIEETYVEACIRSDNYEKAIAIVRGRDRESSISDQNLISRIGQLEG